MRDGVAYSRWQPWPDVEVRTWLLAETTGHVRIHQVKTRRSLRSLEGGFAVPMVERVPLEGTATVRAPGGSSALRDLLGGRKTGETRLGVGSHLMAPLAAMPTLSAVHEPGEFWLACSAGSSALSDDAFADAGRYAFEEGPRMSRDGELWWSADEGSSEARRRAMENSA